MAESVFAAWSISSAAARIFWSRLFAGFGYRLKLLSDPRGRKCRARAIGAGRLPRRAGDGSPDVAESRGKPLDVVRMGGGAGRGRRREEGAKRAELFHDPGKRRSAGVVAPYVAARRSHFLDAKNLARLAHASPTGFATTLGLPA